MLKKLYQDEVGAIISAELVLIMTVIILGVSVGMTHIAGAVAQEMADVASAIGALDQSYNFGGLSSLTPEKGFTSGSGFSDTRDACDCEEITFTPADSKLDVGDGSGQGENTSAPVPDPTT